MTKINRKTAQAVLATVRELVPYGDFTLYAAEHEGMRSGCWSIAWEGDTGDVAWPQVASEAQFRGVYPEGVFVEPMTSWSLGVYPA